MQLTQPPRAETGMLIRKPVAEVFEALVNPAITSKFWFTRGSGRLETGKQITWDWAMYGISINVNVKAIEKNARILFDWSAENQPPTSVEWILAPRSDGTTFVSVRNSGFVGDGDKVVQQALDSASGFALVLAGAKAYLEHNVELNLVRDRFPEGKG